MTDDTNPHLLIRELERGLQRHRRPSLRPEFHCPRCGGDDTQSLAEAINDNRRTWTLETSKGTREGRFIRPDLLARIPGPRPMDLLTERPLIFIAFFFIPTMIAVVQDASGFMLAASALPGLVLFVFGMVGHLGHPGRLATWELKAWERDTLWRCRQCGEEWNPEDRLPTPLPDPSGGVPVKEIRTADLPPNAQWIETYRKAE